jgi:hypothetical protein
LKIYDTEGVFTVCWQCANKPVPFRISLSLVAKVLGSGFSMVNPMGMNAQTQQFAEERPGIFEALGLRRDTPLPSATYRVR